ncbi:MAG: substrate-binding domain-containing protein [Spirochaetes bacterium]|uniref:Substrate-binding domain-containing protein n=1 Tax=Candidatus Ornithospirochaeta stercoripullorum TaxID=2840899 RepID=A0A9D9H2L6_9SPIO|nr:substrate-binding domain-containing protein [Candidatus Ornithospirochaeta stercoripullorum]
MGKRIGFMLANIYQGSGITMWKAIAKAASKHKEDALFVFPGGKLGETDGDEYMRNDIFSLASPESIDGAIIWTSALSGTKDAEDIAVYVLEKAKTMRVVSLGMSIPGCPSVNFDAYHGTLSEIKHMITVHDDKRIAFLRGPDTHPSAEDRFRAYQDSLAEEHIEFSPSLVSSPTPWSEGEAAIKELVEGRKLIPGKDFTALAAASDMLLMAACNYLSRYGYEIPKELHVCGFNDSEENALMPVELTTVRMPVEELAKESYSLISDLCDGHQAKDILLSSDLIVRHSCGCGMVSGIKDGDEFVDFVKSLISSDEALYAVRKLLAYLAGDGDEAFLYRYADLFIASGGDAGALFDTISIYSGKIYEDRKDKLHRRIVFEERREIAKEKQRMNTLTYALNLFKRELLAARSMEYITTIMFSSFRTIGIDKAFLMLYKDFTFTVFIGGFTEEGILNDRIEFPRSNLVPQSLNSKIERGTFVVEPLFYGREELGYIVLGTEWVEGYVLEDIRVSLSSALRGISLLEDANQAKDQAERGERDAENFYARLSEDVMVPLSRMRTALEDGTRLNRDALLKSVLDAEHLLELSLMEKDELLINKKLQALSDVIQSFTSDCSVLPLFEVDAEKLGDSINILIAGNLSVQLEEYGAVISGCAKLCDKISLQYAERVLLMHSCSFDRGKEKCHITLPYPSLVKQTGMGHGIVYPSDNGFSRPPCKAELIDSRKLSACNPRAIVLTSESSEPASLILSTPSLQDRALLIFSPPASTLEATLQRLSRNDELLIACSGYHNAEALENIGRVVSLSLLRKSKGHKLIISVADNDEDVYKLRSAYHSIPLLIVRDKFTEQDLKGVATLSNTMIVNTSVLESDAFLMHLKTIAEDGTLPFQTGLLVKRAIVFLNQNARKQIARWQLAESVNISEDYLARIFRRELGLTPWEYLGIYRIQLSVGLLLRTGKTLSEIAEESGFQDQAYFSRVFRKVKGCSPGSLRKRKKVGIVQ